jgi:protein-S-isoprenylcysteine O-methyltransferase Ste14
MPAYGYAILAAGWLLWVAPFFISRQKSQAPAAKLDRRARWGILFQAIAYTLLWQSPFWAHRPELWRVLASITFFALGPILTWSAIRALGRHWRVDAGLSTDHELVRDGPYRILRHPIYASMFCLFLGTGFLITPLSLLLVATAFLIVGTEVRVRIEDHLLAERFGDEFRTYQSSVFAYLPFR